MYLDNAATTPLTVDVKVAISSFLNNYGNPSSQHSVGDGARKKLAESRGIVAEFIHADPSEIYFTSGGSASNNLAVQGWHNRYKGEVYYCPTCHKSILKQFQDEVSLNGSLLAKDSCPLPMNKDGRVDFFTLAELLAVDDKKVLVVIEYANSETGVIQPVDDIIETCHMFGADVYVDCTGSIAQIPVDIKALGADMIGFSGHKLGALKGCGVLYIRDGFEISPLIYGAQEGGLFGGTENTLGIVALAATLENYDYSSISSLQKEYLLGEIENRIDGVHLIGGGLPHNLYLAFDGVKGHQLMTMLDTKGYQVSTGSACNSGANEPSPALLALEVPDEIIDNGIRITLSGEESFGGLTDFVGALKESVEWLRNA